MFQRIINPQSDAANAFQGFPKEVADASKIILIGNLAFQRADAYEVRERCVDGFIYLDRGHGLEVAHVAFVVDAALIKNNAPRATGRKKKCLPKDIPLDPNVPDLRPVQAAKYANVSLGTINNWMADGKLVFAKVGRMVFIPRREIDRLMARHRRRSLE